MRLHENVNYGNMLSCHMHTIYGADGGRVQVKSLALVAASLLWVADAPESHSHHKKSGLQAQVELTNHIHSNIQSASI